MGSKNYPGTNIAITDHQPMRCKKIEGYSSPNGQ